MATSNHRQDQHSLTMSSPSDKDTDEGFSSSSSSSSFTFNSAQSLLQWSHRAAACTVKMGQWKKEADEKREKRMEERVEREGRRHHRERADREKVDRIKGELQMLEAEVEEKRSRASREAEREEVRLRAMEAEADRIRRQVKASLVEKRRLVRRIAECEAAVAEEEERRKEERQKMKDEEATLKAMWTVGSQLEGAQAALEKTIAETGKFWREVEELVGGGDTAIRREEERLDKLREEQIDLLSKFSASEAGGSLSELMLRQEVEALRAKLTRNDGEVRERKIEVDKMKEDVQRSEEENARWAELLERMRKVAEEERKRLVDAATQTEQAGGGDDDDHKEDVWGLIKGKLQSVELIELNDSQDEVKQEVIEID